MLVESSGYSTRVSDSASRVSGQRTDEIARAEFLKIEIVWSSRGPQAESVDGLSSVAQPLDDQKEFRTELDGRSGITSSFPSRSLKLSSSA